VLAGAVLDTLVWFCGKFQVTWRTGGDEEVASEVVVVPSVDVRVGCAFKERMLDMRGLVLVLELAPDAAKDWSLKEDRRLDELLKGAPSGLAVSKCGTSSSLEDEEEEVLRRDLLVCDGWRARLLSSWASLSECSLISALPENTGGRFLGRFLLGAGDW